MIRDEDNAIGPRARIQLGFRCKRKVFDLKTRHMRVRVGKPGSEPHKEMENIHGGRFPGIGDVFLISHAQQMDAGTLHAPARLIEGRLDFLNHELRHGGVDAPGQFDEVGLSTVHFAFQER